MAGWQAYDVVALDAKGLAPGAHDKSVVGGDDEDLVDAFGLELVDVLDEGRDVPLSAGRGEGSGNGDDDDLLVLELCRVNAVSCLVLPACLSISLLHSSFLGRHSPALAS